MYACNVNRQTTETNAFGTRTNVYHVRGTMFSTTDRNGRVRKYDYDNLDRLRFERWIIAGADVDVLEWRYDKLGRVTHQRSGKALASVPTAAQSEASRLGITNPSVDTFAYDGLGRLTEQTNYDPTTAAGSSGRPEIQQTFDYGFEFWPNVGFRERSRRQENRRDAQSPALGETLFYDDRLGRLESLEDADSDPASSTPQIASKWAAFLYDAAGNFQEIAGGVPTRFVHDKANRLTSITHDLATDVNHVYAYDNASRITSFNTGATTRGYGYDDAGQLTSKTGGTAGSYAYDDNGNRVTVDSQPIVTGPGNRLAQDDAYYYSYDSEGNLTRRTDRATGEATIYIWDHRNRLVGVETLNTQPALIIPSTGWSSYTGQDDASGVLTVEDSGKSVHLTGKAWKRIGFSSLGLPTYYTLTANSVLSFDFYSPSEGNMVAIGLDNANNAINDPKRHFQLAGAVTTGTFAGISPNVSYGGGWQHYEIRLADFAGYSEYLQPSYWNRFTFINNGGGGESLFRNIRLTEGTPAATTLASTTYVYDSEGRRVQRVHDPDGGGAAASASEYFIYDGADLSMTFKGATGSASALAHRYLYGPQVDQVLVDEVFTSVGSQQVSDEALWLLADHQGTIRDIYDVDGVARKHIEYDSFGNVTDEFFGLTVSHPEPIDQLFYYAGQERDEATGFQLHGQRWYIPDMARFASEDPIAADVNLYRYALNNPVIYVDPTGLYTQLPTSYLPALSGSVTGFNRGTPSRAARDLAYSNWDTITPSRQASTGSSWGSIGNVLGNAVYNVVQNVVPPGTRAALGAGVSLAASIPLLGQTSGSSVPAAQPIRVQQENASGGIVSNAWNNVAKPYWSGVLSSPAHVLKMTGPGQIYSLWQGDHPVNAWMDRVQNDGLVAGSLDHAGEYYGGLIEQTGPYQATVGTYIRYRGIFPSDESDAIASREFQERSGVTAGSTTLLVGLGEFVPGAGFSSGPDTVGQPRNLSNGNLFNRLRSNKYDYNELYVQKPSSGTYRLDSYNPVAREIVSRKFTQLSEISVKTSKGYISEAASKYRAGATVANVRSSGSLAGQQLQGKVFLEVPVQIKAIPQAVLDSAAKHNVIVRDINGRIYQ